MTDSHFTATHHSSENQNTALKVKNQAKVWTEAKYIWEATEIPPSICHEFKILGSFAFFYHITAHCFFQLLCNTIAMKRNLSLAQGSLWCALTHIWDAPAAQILWFTLLRIRSPQHSVVFLSISLKACIIPVLPTFCWKPHTYLESLCIMQKYIARKNRKEMSFTDSSDIKYWFWPNNQKCAYERETHEICFKALI